MATNSYNKRPATLVPVHAGQKLYRILPADATYDSNSYNPNTLPKGHEDQGRFEPIYSNLGGYTYVSDSITGAVAEGVLRNQKIPKSGLVKRFWLRNKKIAMMTLAEDIEVAVLHGGCLTPLNLDSKVLLGDDKKYSECRQIASDVLTFTPQAQGIEYACSNNTSVTALMIVTRGGVGPRIEIDDEMDILTDDHGRKLVLENLKAEFGLQYAGSFPGQRS